VADSWVNGLPAGSVASTDRGLQYGDGLFETLTCVDGRVRWLALHLQRLRRGCERLALPLPDCTALAAEIESRAPPQGRCILKLILTRGVARQRGYRPQGDEVPTRILSRHEWPPASALAGAGFRVAVSDVKLGVNPLLAGIKHLNRLEQVLAQAAMGHAPLEEVLMLSSANHVIGGSMSNAFFADDSGLFTPALTECGVEGIMRELVRSVAAAHGLPLAVRPVQAAELAGVREAFVTNVRWGIQSIAMLEGRPLAERGLAEVLRGWVDAARD
jgi:4-amino-4-deoxychorismate lyase